MSWRYAEKAPWQSAFYYCALSTSIMRNIEAVIPHYSFWWCAVVKRHACRHANFVLRGRGTDNRQMILTVNVQSPVFSLSVLIWCTQLSQVSLTLYLLGVKKELSGVNSATLHGVKRTFDCLRMRFKRKSIVMSEAVTPFYFTKLTPVYYLRNFSDVFILLNK